MVLGLEVTTSKFLKQNVSDVMLLVVFKNFYMNKRVKNK